MTALHPDDLTTHGGALWLLEVEWAGLTYRWSSALPDGGPLVITDADGADLEFLGGFDTAWASSFDLFSESSAPPALSLSLWFSAVDDIPQRVADGHDLSTMTATLSRWAPGMAYESRAVVFFGIAREPNYGSINEPVNVTFESPIYRDGAKFPDGRIEAGQISADDDLASGQPYPIVFGAPTWGGETTTTSLAGGSPAFPYDRSGQKLLGGYVWGGASPSALWQEDAASSETFTSATGTDDQGRAVLVITSTAGPTVFDADAGYSLVWNGDHYGAGDLIVACAEASTLRVDGGRMRAVRGQLNAFKFSGYIDTETSPWEWCLRNVIALLPASAYHTADGLAVRVWHDTATSDDAVAALTTDHGLTRVGPVQYENEPIVNELTVKYSPDRAGKYRSAVTVTGRPGLGSPPDVILSAYAMASRARLAAVDAAGKMAGVRSKVIETPIVYDDATALRIAQWQIRARSRRRRVVTYEDATGLLEWIEEGRHVTITDDEIALSSALALVRSRRWVGGRFFLDLVLIDDMLTQ